MESESKSAATSKIAEDRRSAERRRLRLVARVAHATGSIFGHLENISGGGASFVTSTMDPRIANDSDIVLILTSPPNAITQEVHCTARVVRSADPSREATPLLHYGIEFDEPLELDVLTGSN